MSKLAEILEHKDAEVEEAKQQVSEAELKAKLKAVASNRCDFITALKARTVKGEVAIISELKQASPSAGVLARTFVPATLAKKYKQGGAACISVLTDHKYFQGHPDHLKQAKEATKLPTLRKDFIIDPYQIHESNAMGADAILLIVAAFEDPANLVEMVELAVNTGLTVLLECHSAAELDICAGMAHNKQVLLGINNRDLSTLKVDIKTTLDLAEHALALSSPNPIVAESGIHTPEDVQLLRDAGIHCFLIGTALMKAPDPIAKLQQLLGK